MRHPVRRFSVLLALSFMLAPLAHAGTFEDALGAAYANNPRIKAERQHLESTDEGVSQAVSGFRPTVSGTFSDGRQETTFGNAASVNSNYTAKTLRVAQPLFRGGGTWSAYQGALERVKSGQYDLSALEQRVLLDGINAYMNVVELSAILDLSRKNADVLAEQLKAASTRFKVGEVTRTDVAQSQARLSDAKSQVITAEGNLLGAIATYERVIGVHPEGTLAVPENLPELPASLDAALERARSANPQLLSALHNAKASDYDVRSNEAVLLPRVDLVGSLSRQTGSGANGSSDFDQDRIGVEVAVPLYQSGAEWSRIREASATARQRSHESIDRRQSVDEAVTQSWEQLESAIANITTRNDQIKAAALALEGVKQEQQFGARTVLDVLDAEQELFTARTNLVRAQRDRIVAAYTVAFALGQLTPQQLVLKVDAYDPQDHADDVEWQFLGY
jgi:TolC family type I secretion outer membrane protein